MIYTWLDSMQQYLGHLGIFFYKKKNDKMSVKKYITQTL